ncbi:unnamed protein product [Calypogeia fissa]
MGEPAETLEKGAQTALSRSSPEKWNFGILESGPQLGEQEKVTIEQSHDATHPSEFESPTSSKFVKDDTISYPEGGVRAWLVVFGSWCAILPAMGTANTTGSFQSYFMARQLSSYSPAVVGWIFSVYMFIALGGGIVIGQIFDKHGPKWLILSGSLGICIFMFLLGICEQYWHFLLVYGVLGGVSASLLLNPAIAVVGHYFRKNRGKATGIAVSSAAIAGVVFPLMLEHLIPKVGFMWSTRIIGFIYVCACVIACTLIRSRLPPAENANAIIPDFSIFKDSAFSITVFASYLLQWAFYVPLAYISSYALHCGFSSSFSYNVLVFLNLGSIFGRWLPSLVRDGIGRYNSLILMSIVTVLSVFGVWLPVGHTKGGLLVFALSFGFTSGSTIPLTAACVGQLCQTENYGRYLATTYTVSSFGFLTGIPIGGVFVANDHGGYQNLIIFVGACYVGAVAALVVVRILQTGWKLWAVY